MERKAGSKGILNGLKEDKNVNSQEGKNKNNKEETEEMFKRSYTLKKSTIRFIEELKLDFYPKLDREQIVDEAIRYFYEHKKNDAN